MLKAIDNLSSRLVDEEARWAEVEKRVAALEAEREGADVRWRVELEAKQSTITSLQTHYAKQLATINRLKEEVAQLKKKAEGAEREANEWRSQTKELEKQLEVEKLEKQSVEVKLQSERLALQGLRVEVEEAKVAHQTALADARFMEVRLKFLSFEEGKKEVVEEYRHGPLGKVKLSLAVKAGFDYLKAQIPSDVLSSSTLAYPPRVECSLSILQSLEERGARVRLKEDEEDEDKEEGDDDDEGGDDSDDKDEGDAGKGN